MLRKIIILFKINPLHMVLANWSSEETEKSEILFNFFN
ncbi:hypothetical protein L579_3188 [Pantoea sp. AS-PWVM4]|nr:hypothetical protein L579_3188 [Pantoea sp. AS-PWVM4]